MKICIINNLYKPLNRGGAERIVDIVASEFRGQKNEVFIVSTKPYFWQGKKEENTKYINSLYYNLEKLPKCLRFIWHMVDLFDIYHALRVFFIFKEEKPDLIISHNLKGMSYLLPIFIKFSGVKNIHTLHDVQLIHPSGLLSHREEAVINSVTSRMYQSICSRLFSCFDVVISPSRWLLDLHLQRGYFKNCKKLILANPVRLDSGFLVSKKKSNSFKFLFIGQLEKHKGAEELLDVFMLLFAKSECNCSLTIVGDGQLYKKLKNKSENFSNITLLGKKNSKEVLTILSGHDCLVVPSLCYENSPTVIYEAASLGVPVLAARIGGTTELVHYLGGVLFCPGSKDDLGRKLLFMMDNKKAMQDIAQESIKKIELFSLGNYINALLDN